jgi:hypothetical protein
MSTKRKAAKVMHREELADGRLRVVFDRPHNAFKTGMGLMLSESGPCVVEAIQSKTALVVRKIELEAPKPPPIPGLAVRAWLAVLVLMGYRAARFQGERK